jgi:hypothetical protein
MSVDSSTAYSYIAIYSATVPASTTTGCQAAGGTVELLWQAETQNGDALAMPFPTPLRVASPTGKKVCLFAYVNSPAGAVIDASGYYGG